jgi:Ca2+-transporting ATPase
MLMDGGGFDHAAWLAYTILVAGQCVRAYWNRSLREPIHRLGTNRFLLGACLLAIAFQVLIPAVPVLAEAFRATALNPGDWAIVALIAFMPAIAAEAVRTIRHGRAVWVA